MVTRTRYNPRFASGAQMPASGGFAQTARALQGVVLGMRQEEKAAQNKANLNLKNRRKQQSQNAVQKYRNLVDALEYDDFSDSVNLSKHLATQQSKAMNQVSVSAPEDREAYSLLMSRLTGATERGYMQYREKTTKAAQAQNRENILLEHQNRLNTLNLNDFSDENALNTRIAEATKAAMTRLAITDPGQREEVALRLEGMTGSVRQRYNQSQARLLDARTLQQIRRDVGSYDFTLSRADGTRIYNPLDESSIDHLRQDLTNLAETRLADVSGTRGEMLRVKAEGQIESAVNLYRRHAATARQAEHDALAETGFASVQAQFLSEDISLEAAQESLRNIATLQSGGLASEAEIEAAVAEQSRSLLGQKVARMAAEGEFGALRQYLSDPDIQRDLPPNSYNRAVKQLNQAGMSAAKDYIENQQALAVRSESTDDAETIQATVLEMTGNTKTAQQAVEAVATGHLMAENTRLPLVDVAANIATERANIDHHDPHYTDKQARLDSLLQQRQQAEKTLQHDPVAYVGQTFRGRNVDIVAVQENLGVKDPRVMTNAAASELLDYLHDPEIALREKAATLAQGLMQHPELFTQDLIRAGMPKRMQPLLYALNAGAVDETSAPLLVGAMMTEPVKLETEAQVTMQSEVTNALEDYTEYADTVGAMTGDYSYREHMLNPVQEALTHLLSIPTGDKLPEPELLARMLMGGVRPQVTDDMIALISSGQDLNHGELIALRQIREGVINERIIQAQRERDYVHIAGLRELAERGMWHSEDGETFTLLDDAMGLGWSTHTRAEIAEHSARIYQSEPAEPGVVR